MSEIAVRVPSGYEVRNWNLGEGAGVTVLMPPSCKLTHAQMARLRRYVDVLEFEASIAWDDEAKSEEPTP